LTRSHDRTDATTCTLTLEARYGIETLCANWNPMVAMMAAAASTPHERHALEDGCDAREIDAFLDRIHRYAWQ
jgi:hypothetical protein